MILDALKLPTAEQAIAAERQRLTKWANQKLDAHSIPRKEWHSMDQTCDCPICETCRELLVELSRV